MGYYCTVPQCTSLAGKTKNVKFHRFPRDVVMADKWNLILKRGKPYTKYSKVCSLHFTQSDYNVTAMGKNKGQWKTLSKDAVPSQNLPKLNPDGTVMVIRKSRSIKYKEQTIKKEVDSDKPAMDDKYAAMSVLHSSLPPHAHDQHHDVSLPYRLQSLSALADNLTQPNQNHNENQTLTEKPRPDKQDAVMQTDPQSEEEDRPGYSDTSESFNSEQPVDYPAPPAQYERNEYPKDYTKPTEDYIPQTNEEYNKEAERYALERKSHYDKEYKTCAKIQDMYDYTREYPARYDYPSFEERARPEEDLIKQEELSADEKYLYERSKEALEANNVYEQQRLMQQRLLEHVQQQVKTEPDALASEYTSGENVMQPQGSPYYHNGSSVPGYYQQYGRAAPGPELLIAKQNALAAHTQLWQNTMKRPFFYSDTPHYNGSLVSHRYEGSQSVGCEPSCGEAAFVVPLN